MKQTTKSNVGFRDRLDPLNDTVTIKPYGNVGTNLSASALVRTGAAVIVGIMVNSTTAGSIKLWDNTSAAGTVKVNTFTPPAAGFYPVGGIACATGIFATLTGTIDVTVVWNDPTSQS